MYDVCFYYIIIFIIYIYLYIGHKYIKFTFINYILFRAATYIVSSK